MSHPSPELGSSRGTRPTSRKTGRLVATTGTAALALAGITAAVFLGFAVPSADATTVPGATTVSTSHTGTSTGGATGSGSNAGRHAGGGHTGGGHSHQSRTPSSAQILRWQQDLTTLNYYDGDLDGVMSPELQQSIRLLQGDAGLPQTGIMDHATQAAMQKMLHTPSPATGSSGRSDQGVPRGSRADQLG
jgi:peptidoglycan hydrolase-like protein with peptidoglycan-binding domain